MRRVVLGLMACAVAAGCMTSPPAAKSPRIHTAAGIATTLRLASGDSVSGELLALDSATATVLAPRGIVVVPHAMIVRARFEGYPTLVAQDGGYYVTNELWQRLRLDSRYPYGIPAPALAAIMRYRNQERVDTLRAP